MEMILRERQRNPHRCPECSASFEVAYFDDRKDERAALPEVLAEVACPRCGRSRSVALPSGAERTLEVEIDEIGEPDEGAGD